MAVNTMVPARMTTSMTSTGSSQQAGVVNGATPSSSDLDLRPAMADGSGESGSETDGFWFFSITSWYSELNKRRALTVVLLCLCNLINYMDRSTVAGMVDYIRSDPWFGKLDDKMLGLIQTSFVIFYMLTAPVFGAMGDRVNRKLLVTVGLAFWSLATFFGSFSYSFWWFVFWRALVGVGEASYSTVAPAIISDMFVGDVRSKVLAAFYFAIPFGTGLGYIVGSQVGGHASDWRWGLRITPFMGLVLVFLVAFVMVDPARGASEGSRLRPDSTREDLKSLFNNKSFCLSTAAFTCVTFCVGALTWWGPNFAYYGARAACGNKAGCETITQANISYKFGIVLTLAGLMGVPLGSYVAQALRHKVPNVDPLVCGTSLLLSVPVLYFGFIAARYEISWCYGLTFLAGLFLNCNWAVVGDMTLYIVIPIRRSFASATQILCSHALGDAVSPYLLGAIADAVRVAISANHAPSRTESGTFLPPMAAEPHTPQWFEIEFRSLQYALFVCCFFQTVGGFIFLVVSWYVLEDKQRAAHEAGAHVDVSVVSFSPDGGAVAVPDEPLDDDRVPVVQNMFADESQEGESVTEAHLSEREAED